MLLKDFLGDKLPKKSNAHWKHYYNQAIDEIGNIEVGEVLERITGQEIIKAIDEALGYYGIGTKLTTPEIEKIEKFIDKKFGAKKIDEGKIEKAIEKWFKGLESRQSSTQIKEVEEKGLWKADLISETFSNISSGLAKTIKQALEE